MLTRSHTLTAVRTLPGKPPSADDAPVTSGSRQGCDPATNPTLPRPATVPTPEALASQPLHRRPPTQSQTHTGVGTPLELRRDSPSQAPAQPTLCQRAQTVLRPSSADRVP